MTPHAPRPRSVAEWFRQRCRPLPWVLGASMLVSPMMPLAYAAGPARLPQKKPSAPAAHSVERVTKAGATAPSDETAGPSDNATKVKLMYFGADWTTVLRDLAKQTDSELIADRVPAGRYTRRDKTEYTRSEAVRIINREIEPHGFRVLEKGNFLVVIDLPSQRPRYQAAVVKPSSEAPAESAEQPIASLNRAQRSATPIVPVPKEIPSAPRTNSIQLTAHEESEGGVTTAEGVAPARRAAEPLTVVVFRARNQRATDLAKRVYRTFKDRAELVDSGRNGLPAMRVREAGPLGKAPVLFSIAIDEEREELLIDARATEADGMLKLLRKLDTPTLTTDEIQLVSSTKTACLAAVQLPEEIDRIRALKLQEPPRQLAQVDPLLEQPAQPANEPMPAQRNVVPGPLGDVLGNLKGEVNIEAIEDLGVLILRGNEKDVEQVMKVIRELEKLSETTAPSVHLLHLKNVNSEALATLLSSVYEKLTKFPGKATQPRQSVSIVPVSKPNSILVIAPANDMDAILDLADELDQPVDPETEFEVFSLQSAISTQMEEMLTEFYAERIGLGAKILIKSEPRSNTLIVQARPRDLDEVAALIKKIDRDETAAISQLKIFTLKNAVATELAAIINAAIQSVIAPPQNAGANAAFGGQGGGGIGNAQVTEEFRQVKSTVLQFLSVDGASEKKLKSGILADIRITPDPRMNALMVSAPEASLTLIGELIKQLDRPTGQVAEIKVFALANADASLMVQQLQGLFGSGTGAGANQQRQALGIQVAGAEDASSGLIPLKFSVDPRTNSVIAIGAADSLRVVEAIMFRLDESDIRARQNSVYRLKNSPAQQIATAVTTFLTNQRDLATQDPNLVSSVEQLEREVIVVAETVSNSLLISATPRYYEDVMSLVKKLDEAPKQVVIQALLVEVELQDTDEFGIELGFQDSILFNRSIIDNLQTVTNTVTQNNVTTQTTSIVSQSSSPGYLFGNPTTPLGNNTSPNINSATVGSQGLSNFSVGRTNGELGFGGLVLSASSESVSMLLRALAANRQTQVLSRPQIRTLDNQLAQIQQGQNVPIVRGVTVGTTGVANPQIDRDDAGVILTVIPRISPDQSVVMELIAEKSQYNLQSGVPIFTDANTGNVVTSPVKDISTARTTVAVPNGQTIILGGLITSRTDEAHRKVPFLGDIPILGTAFRYDYLQTRRTELLIFLTPRIVLDDGEAEHIKEVEMSRLHYNEAAAEEMHGPLRGVPQEEFFPTDAQGVPLGQPLPPGTLVVPPQPSATIPLPPQPMPTQPTPVPAVNPATPDDVPGPPAAALKSRPASRSPAISTGPSPARLDDSDAESISAGGVVPASAKAAPREGRIIQASAMNGATHPLKTTGQAKPAETPGVARPKVQLGRTPWSTPSK